MVTVAVTGEIGAIQARRWTPERPPPSSGQRTAPTSRPPREGAAKVVGLKLSDNKE